MATEMAKRVLVAYASKAGSTQETAEKIAAALKEKVLEIVLSASNDVETLDSVDAVVLGTSIYNAQLHPDAIQFLTRHQAALVRLPVGVFALGPLSSGAAALQSSRKQLETALKRYPWFKPLDVGVFGGKYDPADRKGVERLLYGSTTKDYRNWDAIHDWAAALPASLGIVQKA